MGKLSGEFFFDECCGRGAAGIFCARARRFRLTRTPERPWKSHSPSFSLVLASISLGLRLPAAPVARYTFGLLNSIFLC